jgi:uncharacterized protein YaiE (UPF0345 family)
VDTLKKWWPTLVTIGGTLIGVLTPSIQGFLVKHPEIMTIVAGVYAILQHMMPSPVTTQVSVPKP